MLDIFHRVTKLVVKINIIKKKEKKSVNNYGNNYKLSMRRFTVSSKGDS